MENGCVMMARDVLKKNMCVMGRSIVEMDQIIQVHFAQNGNVHSGAGNV